MERALPSDDFVIPIYLTLQFECLPYISAYSALLVTFPLSNLWKVVLYEITASLCLFFILYCYLRRLFPFVSIIILRFV